MIWKLASMLVGSKTVRIVASVLAVGLILFFTIQYIQEAERGKSTIDLQGKQIEKRKKIDEAIRNDTGSVSDSLQYLRERQGN